jgi:hypothetical protein
MLSIVAILFSFAAPPTPEFPGDSYPLPLPRETTPLAGDGLHPHALKAIALQDADRPVLPGTLDRLPEFSTIAAGSVTLRIDPAAPNHPEGYVLTIRNNEAVIVARYPAGLFYGCQTLDQLIIDAVDAGTPIPALRITDHPAIDYRAIHIDTKHALDRMGYYYEVIDRLAALKINAIIWEVEDKLGYRRRPTVASPDAFSIEELQALTRYARDRHIEISPLVQGLGHASFILKHDAFKHLREKPDDDWAFCPLHPETYDVQFDLYRDAIDATPGSRYLHIGGDEVHVGSCERCKASGHNPLELHLHWLRKVAQFCKEHDRVPIMWDDMPLKYAGLWDTTHGGDADTIRQTWAKQRAELARFVDLIPRNCVFMRWNYGSPDTPGNELALRYYEEHNIPGMIATAAQTTWYMHPRRGGNVEPIRAFDRLAARSGTPGSLCTAWGDSSPHFETFWRGFAAHAEFAWSPEGRSPEQFNHAFIHRAVGPRAAGHAAGLEDQLIGALGFWDSALLARGRRQDMYSPNPERYLIKLPNPDKPGEWAQRYAARVTRAKAELERHATTAPAFRNAIRSARRGRYRLRLQNAMNDLQVDSARMLLALDAIDRGGNRAAIRSALDHYSASAQAFFDVFAEVRHLDKPVGYHIDHNGHPHLANYEHSHRWMVCVEDRFVTLVRAWLAGDIRPDRLVGAWGNPARTRWKILGVSSAETSAENAPAGNAIDGDTATIWHTAYSAGDVSHPHWIAIDLGEQQPVSALVALARSEQTMNGGIKRYEVHISIDSQTWSAAARGALAATHDAQRIALPHAANARYLRLTVLSEVHGRPWASLAELDVIYGESR